MDSMSFDGVHPLCVNLKGNNIKIKKKQKKKKTHTCKKKEEVKMGMKGERKESLCI